MSDTKQWLSVSLQRALGFESVEDVKEIVESIISKTDAIEIENALTEFLGQDETAKDIIDGYFKKISIPRASSKQAQTTTNNVSASTSTSAWTSSIVSAPPQPVHHNPRKDDDEDMGYGVLAKHKKKGKSGSSNKDKFVEVRQSHQRDANIPVMMKQKKSSKGSSSSSTTSDSFQAREKVRMVCGCQARLHPFVNNCLRCGRIVCEQEDIGPCFFCGHYVSLQGTPQVSPFGSSTLNPDKKENQLSERQKQGLLSAQESLSRLLNFDRTNAERTTVYDDQNDYFDMSNKWISAEERKRLAEKEAKLLQAKQDKSATLVLDFAGRSVVATTQTSEENHNKFKEELMAQVEQETREKQIMSREEAEEHQRIEMERIKPHIKQRSDGTIFVLPTLDVPAPEFVSRVSKQIKEEKSNKNAVKRTELSTPSSSSSNQISHQIQQQKMKQKQASQRIQTEFYDEIELIEPILIDSDASSSSTSKKYDHKKPVDIRGVIENYYGPVWTNQQRIENLHWISKNDGNFFMWAPHDDPMHGRLWNHLFDDHRVSEMKELVSTCKKLGIEFNMALHPKDFDFRLQTHIDGLAKKILQAYEQIGCRSFTLLFSESDFVVPIGCRSLASSQCDLINATIKIIDEFIKLKDEDKQEQVRWMMSPTIFTSNFEANKETKYLKELNSILDPRVVILWSGPNVPCSTIDLDYLNRMNAFFGKNRSLMFWDQMPQYGPPKQLPKQSIQSFDYYSYNHMFFDAYDGRAKEIGHFFKGAFVSSMSTFAPSKITISTALSFFKNPENYNNPKQKQEEAIKTNVFVQNQETKQMNPEGLCKALSHLISISPCTIMSKRFKLACLNRSDAEERAFFDSVRSEISQIFSASETVFPSKSEYLPHLNIIKEWMTMNLVHFDWIKDPKKAAILTNNLRNLRNFLIPVLLAEHDLTLYKNTLFAHPIADKSFRADVQRSYSKFKSHFQTNCSTNFVDQVSQENREIYIKLATEATLSLREMESYLINEYNKEDLIAWRTFLNLLFLRDYSASFLHKMPIITSPCSDSPNNKVIESRIARVKQRLAEEEKMRKVQLQFDLASGILPSSSSDSNEQPKKIENQPSRIHREEIKDLPVPGMRYIREFLTPEQEMKLIENIDSKEWDETLKRRVQQYGFVFQYRVPEGTDWDSARLEMGPFLPNWLKELCEDVYQAKCSPYKPDQAIINEYYPGQGIRHHVDNAVAYEDGILSLSLGSPVVMQFANRDTGQNKEWLLEPRSLLILTKEARYNWSHAIDNVKEDVWNGQKMPRSRRISVTLRKVKPSFSRISELSELSHLSELKIVGSDRSGLEALKNLNQLHHLSKLSDLQKLDSIIPSLQSLLKFVIDRFLDKSFSELQIPSKSLPSLQALVTQISSLLNTGKLNKNQKNSLNSIKWLCSDLIKLESLNYLDQVKAMTKIGASDFMKDLDQTGLELLELSSLFRFAGLSRLSRLSELSEDDTEVHKKKVKRAKRKERKRIEKRKEGNKGKQDHHQGKMVTLSTTSARKEKGNIGKSSTTATSTIATSSSSPTATTSSSPTATMSSSTSSNLPVSSNESPDPQTEDPPSVTKYLRDLFWRTKQRSKTLRRARLRKLRDCRHKVDNFHCHVQSFLVKNYDHVYLPPLRVSELVKHHQPSENVSYLKKTRFLAKKTVREMLNLRHYAFRRRLEQTSAQNPNFHVHTDCSEEWTSKVCGSCLEINRELGASKIFKCPNKDCKDHGVEVDRDANAASNLARKLVTEWTSK